MKIDWSQTAAGASLRQVRRLMMALNGSHPDHFTAGQFAHLVRTWPEDQERPDGHDGTGFADRLLQAMAASDLIMVAHDERMRPLHGWFVFSDTGISLCKSMPQRYTRAEADEAVQGMLAAVEKVKADPALLYDVSRLAIYGSYLDDGDDLGDVDVSFELKPRHARERTRRSVMRLLSAHPKPKGHRGDWAEDATLAVLIGRTGINQDGVLQLTPWDNAETMGWRMRLVYPEVRDIPATRPADPRPPICFREGDASALERIAAEADGRLREWEEELNREWQETGWLDIDHKDLTGRVTEIIEIISAGEPEAALGIVRMNRRITSLKEPVPVEGEEGHWLLAERQACDTTVPDLLDLMGLGLIVTRASWGFIGTIEHEGRSVPLILDLDEDHQVLAQIKTGRGAQ